MPGQRIVLERNPYYWKTDAGGTRLPYLEELHFVLAGTEDMQVLRFRAGEADVINRISARNFAALSRANRRGYSLENAGPGFEYNFLFFNLNDLPENAPRTLLQRQEWFRRKGFRQAVSAAISREDMVRLLYLGYGVPIGSPVPPEAKGGSTRNWLAPHVRSTVLVSYCGRRVSVGRRTARWSMNRAGTSSLPSR